jgi:hypothetical protein
LVAAREKPIHALEESLSVWYGVASQTKEAAVAKRICIVLLLVGGLCFAIAAILYFLVTPPPECCLGLGTIIWLFEMSVRVLIACVSGAACVAAAASVYLGARLLARHRQKKLSPLRTP